MTSEEINPDVSVVVPAWGDYAGRRLDEALASLREQDLASCLIVVDNASDPPLGPLPGAQVIRSETRMSVGAARNLGLQSVATPYVVFWDADDLMLPGTLRFLHETIEAHPDAVLVAASIMEGDPPVPHRWPRRWAYAFATRRRLFAFTHAVWSLFPSTGSAIMRTQAVRESGYTDANIGEDWVLGVSLAFRGRVLLEARPGRLYRRHAGSLWETQRSARQLLRNAAAVRRRLRSDPEVPRMYVVLLPLIAVLQVVAVRIFHPLAEMVRVIRPRPRSST